MGECFFLVTAFPGCPGPKAIKRLCACVRVISCCNCLIIFSALMGVAELAKGIQYEDPIKTA